MSTTTNVNTEVYAGIMSCYTRLMLQVTHAGQLTHHHKYDSAYLCNMPSHLYTNEQIQWQYGPTKIH